MKMVKYMFVLKNYNLGGINMSMGIILLSFILWSLYKDNIILAIILVILLYNYYELSKKKIINNNI